MSAFLQQNKQTKHKKEKVNLRMLFQKPLYNHKSRSRFLSSCENVRSIKIKLPYCALFFFCFVSLLCCCSLLIQSFIFCDFNIYIYCIFRVTTGRWHKFPAFSYIHTQKHTYTSTHTVTHTHRD